MNSARVELPTWGVTVSVVDNRLCAGRAAYEYEEDDDDQGDLLPVDFLCADFMADASRALQVDFTTDEFDVVSCDCRRQEQVALRITSTP